MSRNQLMNYIIIAIITFGVAYLLGLTIISVVDHRLSEISINMPEIKVPEIKLPHNYLTQQPVANDQSKNANYYHISPKVKKVKVTQTGGGPEIKPRPNEKEDPGLNLRRCKNDPTIEFDEQRYRSESKTVPKPKATRKPDLQPHYRSLPATYPNDCGQHRGMGEQPLKNTAQNVPTYYRDPKDMTTAQRLKFKRQAKVKNMTVQDYHNWLLLFRTQPEELEPVHRENLRRVIKGDRLRSSDIPKQTQKKVLPTAESRYNKKFNSDMSELNLETGDDSLNNSEFLVHAANFDDYDHYLPPRNLKHLSHFNPDQYDKLSANKFLDDIRFQISKKQEKQDRQN